MRSVSSGFRPFVLALVLVITASVAIFSGRAEEIPLMDGLPTAVPEDVGMSSTRLERIDRIMQSYVSRGDVAGAVSLVARRGRVVHFSTFGDRHIEAAAPMTHDTIFRIG